MQKFTLSILCAVVIAGCSSPRTPEQICYSSAYGEANTVLGQISEIEGALAKGYRTVRSTQPTTRMGTCTTNNPGYRPISYRCQKNSTMTVETPVSIDYSEERKKLAAYKRQYSNLKKSADRQYSKCLKNTL